MKSDAHGDETTARHRGRDSSARGRGGDSVSQEDLDSVLSAFSRLVQAAADTGRDWKLVEALLQTIVELVLESRGDVFDASEAQEESAPRTKSSVDSSSTEEADKRRLRLRPAYRLRLEAIIDSWSDDETADYLLIGLRQVQRRAREGELYYFLVNRKRRYPVWQFDRFCGVLGGVAEVAREIPESWSHERVYEFMTTRSTVLKLVTPAQWLLMKQDPESIIEAIAQTT